ncbi:MAG: hypothetical protein OWV35_02625, partial [Firmicutes bacterium]|nr:hypothetical protein [Bacillota bacterium]
MKAVARYWDGLLWLAAAAGVIWAHGNLRWGCAGVGLWVTGWILGRRVWPPSVEVARQLRHRQANDLQALAGWLELGRPERALALLEGRMGETRCQAEWWRRVSPFLLPA